MVTEENGILHHSDRAIAGPADLGPSQMFDRMSGAGQVSGRIQTLPDGTKVYELAETILPPSAVPLQDGGAIFFIFVIHLYHRMNQRLRQTQEYTRRVVDSMANGLLSIDDQGRVRTYNNLSLEILGLTPAEIGQLDLSRVIDFQTSGIRQTLEQCVTIMDREIHIVKPEGERLPLAISVTPISTEEDDCQGAVIILRDPREIKRLEEKVRRTEKLAALGKLSAAVAHEIRNPLSSIRGFAKFLGHGLKERPRERGYAEVMVKEVDRINRVVTDLLNFARPMELALENVNPAELVEHTVRLVEGDAHFRKITMAVDIEKSPQTAYLDPYQITQMLLNLMLNALQVAGEGQIVKVGAALDTEPATMVFWVEDNGPGIDEDHIENI